MATPSSLISFLQSQNSLSSDFEKKMYNRSNLNSIDYPFNNLQSEKAIVSQMLKVLKEYQILKDYFPTISETGLLRSLALSLPTFMEIPVDAFSVELTKEESVFFTLKIGSYVFYVEQYLDNELESTQFVLTSFESNKIVFSKSGNQFDLAVAINQLVQKNMEFDGLFK